MKNYFRKKIVYTILLAILLLILAAGVFYYVKYFGYEWMNDAAKAQAANLEWQKGEYSKFAGFNKKYTAEETMSEKCATEKELNRKDYIRIEGGMCPTLVKLSLREGQNKKAEIVNAEALMKKFGKIDTAEKAISLVALTTSDLQLNTRSLLDIRTAKSQNGYFVEYTSSNTFGCGAHNPRNIIVTVSEDGKIETVAFEKEKPSFKPELCID